MKWNINLLIFVCFVGSIHCAAKRKNLEGSLSKESASLKKVPPSDNYKATKTIGPAIVAIQIIDDSSNTTKGRSKNSKRTIESSVGYGGYNGNNFVYKSQEGKYEVYPYSQEDIPPYRGGIYHSGDSVEIQKSYGYSLGTLYSKEHTKPQDGHSGSASYHQTGHQQYDHGAGQTSGQHYFPTLFSTLNQGHLSALTSYVPQLQSGGTYQNDADHGSQYVVPVISLKVYTDQLANPIYPNLPATHPYANYLNMVNLQSLLSGYIHPNAQVNTHAVPVSGYQQQQHEDLELETHENYPSNDHTQVIFTKNLHKTLGYTGHNAHSAASHDISANGGYVYQAPQGFGYHSGQSVGLGNYANQGYTYNVPSTNKGYSSIAAAHDQTVASEQNQGYANAGYDIGHQIKQQTITIHIPEGHGAAAATHGNVAQEDYAAGNSQEYKKEESEGYFYPAPNAANSGTAGNALYYQQVIMYPQQAYQYKNAQQYEPNAQQYEPNAQTYSHAVYTVPSNVQVHPNGVPVNSYEEETTHQPYVPPVTESDIEAPYNYHAHPIQETKYKRSGSKKKTDYKDKQ